ncbi:MAG: DUF2799 domain-containing protein [Paracoccaceae bacterium]
MISGRNMLVAFLVLSSCASLSESQCRTGDWQGIGYRDGTNGALKSRFRAHVEACAEYGVQPDKAAWLAGREVGLKVYCTEASAYHLGRTGGHLNAVCPEADARAIRKAYRAGERYYSLTQDIHALESQRTEILAALKDADETVLPILRKQLRSIDAEIFRLQLQRNLYDLPYYY